MHQRMDFFLSINHLCKRGDHSVTMNTRRVVKLDEGVGLRILRPKKEIKGRFRP